MFRLMVCVVVFVTVVELFVVFSLGLGFALRWLAGCWVCLICV